MATTHLDTSCHPITDVSGASQMAREFFRSRQPVGPQWLLSVGALDCIEVAIDRDLADTHPACDVFSRTPH